MKQVIADTDYTISPYQTWQEGQLPELIETPEIPELHEGLFDYQVPAVERCVNAFETHRFHILGDTMGLGKTPQGLQIARHATHEGARTLTICLANSRGMLEENYKPWFGDKRRVQSIYKGTDKPDPEAHIITSYSLASKILPLIGDVDFCILDECHSLANHKTKQTQAVIQYLLAQTCPILGMSGTPIKNCPIDLWPLLYSFGPAWAKMTYVEFAEKYCQPFRHPHTGAYIVRGFRNQKELQFNLRATCLTRRVIKEVRDDLPEPKISFAYVEENDSIKAELMEERQIYDMKTNTVDTSEMSLGDYSRIRRILAMHKADKVIELVHAALKKTEKVCVFCHTVELANSLKAKLSQYGAVQIIGSTPPKVRDANVKRFQTDPGCRVFVGNIKAAGTAITLTASNVIIMAEASWVPSDNDQVIGRIRRHGQTKQTYVVYVIIRGSLDEVVIEKAYGKKQGVEQSLDAIGEH